MASSRAVDAVIHALALLVTLAVIWIIPAVLVARVAERRGRGFVPFLTLALLVPWPIVLLVVAFAPPRRRS